MNYVVRKRFVKKLQMRRTRRGVLETRVQALNVDLQNILLMVYRINTERQAALKEAG